MVKTTLEKAIAKFHPNSTFTNACLSKMTFSNRYLSDREKLALLGIVKMYAKDAQQLTLVNYIGYLERKRSDEVNLPELLLGIREHTKALPEVGSCRSIIARDDTLRAMIDWKRPPATGDVSDKDY